MAADPREDTDPKTELRWVSADLGEPLVDLADKEALSEPLDGPESDFDALEETAAILSDPDMMALLAQSEAEVARGEIVTAEELAEVMRRRRERAVDEDRG